MDSEDGISLNFVEKSLQNLSIDIEQDGDTFINSPLVKKSKMFYTIDESVIYAYEIK